MHPLTTLIKEDMCPSLGVTEPGAIALAVSRARKELKGDIRHIRVEMNSGMYKNAFTCGIPGTSHVGAVYAAALGALAGDPDLSLEALAHITSQDIQMAEAMVKAHMVEIIMAEITPEIFIRATVVASDGQCTVVIRHTHTNIVSVSTASDGEMISKEEPLYAEDKDAAIHQYTFDDLYAYAMTVDTKELAFLKNAWELNLDLLSAGLAEPRTVILHHLYRTNGDRFFSNDSLNSAQLLCAGAVEARVLGVGKPAMSITGSGSHGIIAVMPLYAIAECEHYLEDLLLRAAAFSCLITQYIKEYSGRLSALCGCGIAAGTGMACGAAMLRGMSREEIIMVLNHMALGITGMICDGGNHGCAIKCITAVDAAFRAVDMVAHGIEIDPCHGICGSAPEDTMRNIGQIASPGMIGTERVIVEIMAQKLGR